MALLAWAANLFKQSDPGSGEGVIAADGGALYLQKSNLAAVAAPTGSDNFAQGWKVGSVWHYAGNRYVCTGDGVWQQFAMAGHSHSAVWGSAYSTYQYVSASTEVTWAARSSGGGMSNSGNGFSVPSAGKYLVNYHLSMDYAAGSIQWIYSYIRVNNSNQSHGRSTAYITRDVNESNAFCMLSGSGVFTLSASDVVELYLNVGSIDMYIRDASFTAVRLGD